MTHKPKAAKARKPRQLDDFMRDAGYLPAALRDFHAQKEVFKGIAENFEQKPNYPMPDWVNAHVYVVDYFLWFMAKHGYTLQRSRAAVGFKSLEDTLEKWRSERIQRFADMYKKQDEVKP